MKVIIIWDTKESENLFDSVNESIEDLWLNEFVIPKLIKEKEEIEEYKKVVEISKFPALVIEEESIDFKDVIFEGFIPEKSELTQMFVSIIWWEETWGWCGSAWWCGSCSSSEACWV